MANDLTLTAADIWKFVTAKLQEGTIVPVLGPGVITFGEDDRPLYPWLLGELSKSFKLERTPASLHRLVCEVRSAQGTSGEKTVRSRIDDLLKSLSGKPASPLMKSLAALPKCHTFLTLGFDPLFENAVRETRPGQTLQIWNSFKATTDLPSASSSNLVLGYLFGKATATPSTHSFNLWDADALEIAFQLLPMRNNESRFGNLGDTLTKDLLFIGADLSDWALRFLLRIIRNKQLSMSAEQELFLAERDDGHGDDPVAFFNALNNNIYFQQSDPVAFARELCKVLQDASDGTLPGSPAGTTSDETSDPAGSAFISYAHEDREAAVRIASSLRARNCKVWLDEHRLGGGDALEEKIGEAIRECAAFVSVISRTTERSPKSYARAERRIAADDAMHRLPGFYFPVIVDNTPAPPKAEPPIFWDRTKSLGSSVVAEFAPEGRVSPAFVDRIVSQLKASNAS